MNRWLSAGLAVCFALVVTGLLAKKSVHNEIVINAAPDEVWSAITDAEAYGGWNPIFVHYEGPLQPNSSLTLHLKMGEKPSPVQVTVEDFVPNQWLHQAGGYPLILTYDHNWHLEAVPGGTKVIQHEDYTGLYVLFWDPAPVGLLYEAASKNLKARLENSGPDVRPNGEK